ncbi:hypothetical protein BESB_058880 [Besnoitia besnoiti]|uniref:Uncharacterized protein n=1 Tax=Besnoitia besnoiti TaxID=94643 RepID=A0A2A9MFH0_BESBE|nr:hypothetical protein BESB_058880 [Besnoitia besnoiti]PFH35001.1 hypothetical protein BESB_058880 [Besnoitia besnoiti]
MPRMATSSSEPALPSDIRIQSAAVVEGRLPPSFPSSTRPILVNDGESSPAPYASALQNGAGVGELDLRRPPSVAFLANGAGGHSGEQEVGDNPTAVVLAAGAAAVAAAAGTAVRKALVESQASVDFPRSQRGAFQKQTEVCQSFQAGSNHAEEPTWQTPRDLQSVVLLQSGQGGSMFHVDAEAMARRRTQGGMPLPFPGMPLRPEHAEALTAEEAERTAQNMSDSTKGKFAVDRAHPCFGESDVVSESTRPPSANGSLNVEEGDRDTGITADTRQERPRRRQVPVVERQNRDEIPNGRRNASQSWCDKAITTGGGLLMSCCGGKGRRRGGGGRGNRSANCSRSLSDTGSSDREILLSERTERSRLLFPHGGPGSRGQVLVAAAAVVSWGDNTEVPTVSGLNAVSPTAFQPGRAYSAPGSRELVSRGYHCPAEPTFSGSHQRQKPQTRESPTVSHHDRASEPVHATNSSGSESQGGPSCLGLLTFLAWCAQPCGVTSGPGGTEFPIPPPLRHRRRRLPDGIPAEGSDKDDSLLSSLVGGPTCMWGATSRDRSESPGPSHTEPREDPTQAVNTSVDPTELEPRPDESSDADRGRDQACEDRDTARSYCRRLSSLFPFHYDTEPPGDARVHNGTNVEPQAPEEDIDNCTCGYFFHRNNDNGYRGQTEESMDCGWRPNAAAIRQDDGNARGTAERGARSSGGEGEQARQPLWRTRKELCRYEDEATGRCYIYEEFEEDRSIARYAWTEAPHGRHSSTEAPLANDY